MAQDIISGNQDMSILQIVVIAFMACAAIFLIYAIIKTYGRGEQSVQQRFRQVRATMLGAPSEQPITTSRERELFPTLSRLMSGTEYTKRLLNDIARADWHLKPSEFVGISLAAMGVGAVLFTLITHNLLLGIVIGLICYYIPKVLLKSATARRKAALESQINDMIMLVSSALRTGYSFLKALQVVSKEMAPPISGVCKGIVEECQLGVPLEDAMVRTSQQTGSYDMDLIATAVIIQTQVGGSLAEILDSIGETIRERIQIQSEVSALTAEGRITGIVLVLLSPILALALSVINPGYMTELIRDPLGIKLIIGAVVLQIIGYFTIRKMSTLDI
ncbi:type II secretion system F family protein [bacterium]|nr:type II secretion system F family protein [bacterium]